MMRGTLTIGEIRQPLTAEYALRFVDGEVVQPQLYFQGKRVVKQWTLTLVAQQLDQSGEGNANTC